VLTCVCLCNEFISKCMDVCAFAKGLCSCSYVCVKSLYTYECATLCACVKRVGACVRQMCPCVFNVNSCVCVNVCACLCGL
jgi:hypothetical protein